MGVLPILPATESKGAVRFDGPWPRPVEGVRTARTDSNGEFAVTDLRPVQASDYIKNLGNGSREVPVFRFRVEHRDFAKASIRYERIPDDVDVVLHPAAAISGRFCSTENVPHPTLALSCRAFTMEIKTLITTPLSGQRPPPTKPEIIAWLGFGLENTTYGRRHQIGTVEGLDSFEVKTGKSAMRRHFPSSRVAS